jgi:hypothetical protein
MEQPFFERLLQIAKKGRCKANTYLFWGLWEGKRDAAKEFIKALNCRDAPDGCMFCECIQRECADILSVKPHSGIISIQSVREARIWAMQPPSFLRKKAVLVEEAECMREEGQNALLRLAEEMPQFTVLIMLSCTQEALLPTLRSRCFPVRFLPKKEESEEIEEEFVTEAERFLRGQRPHLSFQQREEAERFLRTLFFLSLKRVENKDFEQELRIMELCLLGLENLLFYQNPSNLMHLLFLQVSEQIH